MNQMNQETLYTLLTKHAFIHLEQHNDDKIDYRIDELIQDEKRTRDLIEVQKLERGTKKAPIVGTLFGKKYSVLTMGFYTVLAQYGIIFDMSPNNVGVRLEEGKPNRYFIKESALHKVEDLSEEEIQGLIRTYIVHHLEPLCHAVEKVSKCKASHMLSINSHNLFQRNMKLKDDGLDPQRVDQYLHYLTSDELFEQDETNPLQYTFELHTPKEGKPFHIRKDCCLSYLLHNGNKEKCCGTCPHLFPSK